MIATGHNVSGGNTSPGVQPHTLRHSSEEAAMRVDLPPGNLKNRVPAREGNESTDSKEKCLHLGPPPDSC